MQSEKGFLSGGGGVNGGGVIGVSGKFTKRGYFN